MSSTARLRFIPPQSGFALRANLDLQPGAIAGVWCFNGVYYFTTAAREKLLSEGIITEDQYEESARRALVFASEMGGLIRDSGTASVVCAPDGSKLQPICIPGFGRETPNPVRMHAIFWHEKIVYVRIDGLRPDPDSAQRFRADQVLILSAEGTPQGEDTLNPILRTQNVDIGVIAEKLSKDSKTAHLSVPFSVCIEKAKTPLKDGGPKYYTAPARPTEPRIGLLASVEVDVT